MPAELIDLEAARARVLAAVPERLAAEPVALPRALGRVLADDVVAADDVPGFDNSAMDGFAVRAADTAGAPVDLPLAGESRAGHPAATPLPPGAAMAISTGAMLPEGADAVVRVEDTAPRDGAVEVRVAVETGRDVRRAGDDVQTGSTVLRAGARLGAAELGVLASVGVAEASCTRRPRVAVLTTGTELRSPGEPLEPGQVYEANGLMAAAALTAAGAEVERLPAVEDDDDAHRAAIARGLEADVLVTSGGVSVGPHDLVRKIEAELGVDEVFWGVAVKPGKPVSFGVHGRTLVFGLPGNPVSSLIGLELFVKPAVLALQGALEPMPRFELGWLGSPLRRNEGRDELVRARSQPSDDGVMLEPVAGQESHMIGRASAADSLVLVPRGEGELAAGAPVRYLRLAY